MSCGLGAKSSVVRSLERATQRERACECSCRRRGRVGDYPIEYGRGAIARLQRVQLSRDVEPPDDGGDDGAMNRARRGDREPLLRRLEAGGRVMEVHVADLRLDLPEQ